MAGRRLKGVALTEATASLCLLLPLVFLIVFAVVEISYALFLKANLAQGARQAARDLAMAYGQDPAVASDRSLQDAMVFDHVRLTNILNDSRQFEDPVFNTGSNPHTVQVSVKYLSNQYGLPPFPHQDPLNLGSQFVISAQSTYRLE